MKNTLRFLKKLTPMLALAAMMMAPMWGWGQGLESFTNSTATATYADGSFTGDAGFIWTFGHSRDEDTFPITGKGLMLRRASDSYLEATIPGGVGTFSLQYRKAFTGSSARQLELIVNDVQVATTPEFGSGNGADPTVYTFTVENINATDDVLIKIKNVGATTGNRQSVIDNISWTGYTGGGTPVAAIPTFDPVAGNYLTAQNVVISTTTENATIYYTTDGSDPDNTKTEYTGAIPVSTNTTLKAIAYADGYDPSGIATAVYSFPIEVADIASLRAGATDGTIYRLTGEAVLTYQTSVRNAKYIQDATGAILIDDNAGAITTFYNLYDGITGITGTLGLYNGMLQFTPVADPGVATSTGNSVTPLEITLTSLTTAHQAMLVKVLNTTITETGNFAASTNYTLTDGSKGTGVLRTAYSDLDYIGTPIPEAPQDMTGVILQFNTDLQLVPRSTTDFVTSVVPWPVTFYVDMTNAPAFTTVEAAGDFNGWAGDAMSLVSDNIYTFTTAAIFDADDVVTFKFRTDGTTWEQDPNRTYTVVAGTNEYHAVWNVMVPAEITFANLQSPASAEIEVGNNFDVYARVYANGLTGVQGDVTNLQAWIGFSSTDTDPANWTNWENASFNQDYGNNEEYTATIGASISEPGVYYYASRFKLGLSEYKYGGFDGGFWDGTNNVSGVLTINATQPSSHVTDFAATANSSSSILVSWADTDASGYLIKGSDVGYESIAPPVDGIAEADDLLVKNIASEVGTHQFTGLTPNTTYYFKIFPYNGSGSVINYKTDGTVPEASAVTDEIETLLLVENFDYADGQLLTDNGWTAHSGAGTQAIDVVVPGLTFDGYAASGVGGAARVDNNGEDVNRTFAPQESGSIYAAFVISAASSNNAGYFFHLAQNTIATTTYVGRVWINATGTQVGIGTETNVTISANTPTLLVVKYNLGTKLSSLYVLNTMSVTEPTSADATFQETATLSNIGAVCLRQYNASQNILVDGIIVTTTWADLVGTVAPATSTYTNTGNWSETANWSNGLPTGTTDVIINGNVTVDDVVECNDMTVSPTGAVTVGAGPSNGLIVNGNFLIESNATGTGSFIGAAADYAIGGTTTVQRYLTGGWDDWDAGWHQLSSPVAAQPIADFATTGSGNDYDFYGWSEPTATWMNYKAAGFSTWNGGTNFNVGQGYLVSYEAANTTQTFTGELNTADVVFANLSNGGASFNGWHLLGNPFASALVWNDGNWILNNTAGNAKIWHETNKSYSDIAASGIIPSAQGFMVQVSSATNGVGIPGSSRTHSATPFYKSVNEQLLLVAAETEGGSAQESKIMVNPMATEGFDFDYDSRFLAGYAPQLYSVVGDEMLSTSSLPELASGKVIPLGFVKNAATAFTIELKESIPAHAVYLTDKKTDIVTNLTETPVYSFTSSEGDDPNRFELKFGAVGIDDNIATKQTSIYSNGQLVYISSTKSANALINIYNVTGQQVYANTMVIDGQKQIALNTPTGWYIVKVTTATGVATQKVFIKSN